MGNKKKQKKVYKIPEPVEIPGSDDEIWGRSPTPEETYTGIADDDEWPVEIIGEEVNYWGEVLYEAAWSGWRRPDGTNTTWEKEDSQFGRDMGKMWRKTRSRAEDELLSNTEIEVWTTTDIHNGATRLRAQAYEHKLKLARKAEPDPVRLARALAESMIVSDSSSNEATGTPTVSRASLRQTAARRLTTENSVRSASSFGTANSSSSGPSSKTASSRPTPATSQTSASSSSKQHPIADTLSEKVRGKRKAESPLRPPSPVVPAPVRVIKASRKIESPPQSPSPGARVIRSLPRGRVKKETRRELLQNEWNCIARNHYTAGITFTNEVDDEEVPFLAPDFQYLEAEYKTSERIEQDPAFFTRCDCKSCKNPSRCGCQESSDLVDADGDKVFAYTSEGYFSFQFERWDEVIECNQYCKCTIFTCPNRVAQQPRDVAVDIFKTERCGWGVRPRVSVTRGKVLGIYTGLLLRRAIAATFSEELKTYCFDLDGRENMDEEPPEDAYSVDSRTCGNWTRFINHSCSPNLRVYPVIYDSIPEMNTPYLAFVATKDIPAWTEFTFDYDPSAADVKITSKGKSKMKATKIPPGAKACECGSVDCRGYVRV